MAMKRTCDRLTDAEWDSLRTLLPPQKPKTGRPAKDHRTVVDGILWQHATGAPWRQLPEHFGRWQTVYSRLRRWQESGVWVLVEATLASHRSAAVDHHHLSESTKAATARRTVTTSRPEVSNNGSSTRWSMW